MKKARSTFQFHDMYVQHYIPSNTEDPKDVRIHYNLVHNPFMEKKYYMLSEKEPAKELDENNQKKL